MPRKFLLMAALLFSAVTLLHAATPRKQRFDFDWQFALNDTAKWQPVDLPHDWSILQPFDKQAPAGNDGGYLPTGKGWYRKTFNLTNDYQGKALRLYFEGVYMNSEVYVNGKLAGGHEIRESSNSL